MINQTLPIFNINLLGMAFIVDRVTVKEFGSLPGDSPLLVDVPTAKGHSQQRMHRLAAERFVSMSLAVEQALGLPLLCASGWRLHRWISWQDYTNFVIKKYGSVAEGRKWLAFDSPHETGLCCDFGCGGLEPDRLTIPSQIKTPLYGWLRDNACDFGFGSYLPEPWHMEHRVSLKGYRTGIVDGTPPSQPVTTCSDQNDVCVEDATAWSPLVSG